MNTPERFRTRRLKVYENLFSAGTLCVTGFLVMPSLLFNPGTGSRIIQFFFFWFLAWLSGKKINFLVTILIIAGIVLFNLIIPYGSVLFSVGSLKITAGALNVGIRRAVTLEGLVILSRCTIRQDLRIPGVFGGLIGESFRIFARITGDADITGEKNRITRRNFFSGIDRLLLELSEDNAVEAAACATTPAKTQPLGFGILAAVVALSWLPVFVVPLI